MFVVSAKTDYIFYIKPLMAYMKMLIICQFVLSDAYLYSNELSSHQINQTHYRGNTSASVGEMCFNALKLHLFLKTNIPGSHLGFKGP